MKISNSKNIAHSKGKHWTTISRTDNAWGALQVGTRSGGYIVIGVEELDDLITMLQEIREVL